MTKHTRFGAIAILVGLGLLLTACDSIREMPLIRSEKGPEYRIVECEPGVPTKLLRVSLLHPPLTLNPTLACDRVSALVSSQLTATLYRYEPVANEFQPWLATGYDRDVDSKVFTIHLRRRVTFSDGSPFSADDVLTTINYILNPDVKTALRAYMDYGGQRLAFAKLDDETIQCTAAKALYAIEPILARIPVLPAGAIQAAVSSNRLERLYSIEANPAELASIGPFVIQSYSPEEKRLILVRNPRYWVTDSVGRNLPYLDQVVFSFSGTSVDQSVKFRTGESDIIDYIDPADAARLENVRGLQMYDTGPSCATYVAWFNQNMKTDPKTKENYIPQFRLRWFSDLKFRQAISSLFDRGEIVSKVLQGNAIPGASLISPLEQDWFVALTADSYSLPAARQKLSEAGFVMNTAVTPNALYGPNKVPVQITLSVLSGDAMMEKIALQAEGRLNDVGIKATMVSLPYDLFYQKVYSTYDYDMALMLLEQPEHPYFLKELLASNSSGHLWYPEEVAPASETEKAMDGLLDDMYGVPDWATRQSAAQKLAQRLEEGKFLIPVVKPHGLFGAKGKIKNLRMNFRCTSLLWNLEELYILEE
jgi:peptide/nickel transport system substrate-binding protein